MIASKVNAQTLTDAATAIGVRADVETLNAKGTRHRVKLYPIPPATAYTASGRRRKGDAGDAPYQREAVGFGSAGRRVHAVCWHGFRDYFRAVYRVEPLAVFRTAVDTWRGSEDFEARHRESGFRNIGPPIAPVEMVNACRCPESGCVGTRPAGAVFDDVGNDTADAAGTADAAVRPDEVPEARWSEYNRKFNELLCRQR